MKTYKPIPLEKGKYYHIYNRGNNGIDIFYDKESYFYFLKLYNKYISPIADTFAWCLLKNHFHFLIYIRLEEEIGFEKLKYSTITKPKEINPSKQFGHFFNAYTQSINKKFSRTGNLFEKPFQRREIESETYFQNLIYYIHNNPVTHGFVDKIKDYPWNSYHTIISDKPTKLKRQIVIEYYGDLENFIFYHNQNCNLENITDLIIE
ncbi:hypothetical protein EG240_04310 [Paenimyroides tangerinum]|uniref:Transposase IS200-like domain-containing protein n=1 Tax=Paenimyroides tangerinum TaxID=2488728 RepID=A0A3P3WA40_9FLAO|nr:hypothetical protein [Paenimyroides tangerinum]RRJ92015.1 hypothetical protein EG240_04310 [Paenimyroides tangerinum]